VVLVAVTGALVLNLSIYLVGRACGGAFTYTQGGKLRRVDATAVALLSAVPALISLTVIAWLSSRWPTLISAAKVIGPLMAVATIGLMTLPAGFDTTTTLSLSAMHLSLVPATWLALRALTPLRPQ
jgi:hypothetical protein